MSTPANSNQKKRRLEGKDFITIGIYTVIYMVITMLIAILGFIPIFIPLMAPWLAVFLICCMSLRRRSLV